MPPEVDKRWMDSESRRSTNDLNPIGHWSRDLSRCSVLTYSWGSHASRAVSIWHTRSGAIFNWAGLFFSPKLQDESPLPYTVRDQREQVKRLRDYLGQRARELEVELAGP